MFRETSAPTKSVEATHKILLRVNRKKFFQRDVKHGDESKKGAVESLLLGRALFSSAHYKNCKHEDEQTQSCHKKHFHDKRDVLRRASNRYG